ncbi:MAG: hypothetical protein ACTSPB_21240 [Candidatus Thorarchaeota archaeon]
MMRRQVYEWRGVIPSATYPRPYVLNQDPVLTVAPAIPAWINNAREPLDIFVGGLGNNLDIPGYVKATQFIVIDELSLWPPAATANPWVETTQYFQNPDGSVSGGISGLASPFGPERGNRYAALAYAPVFYMSDTPLYVLPGQTWGVNFQINQLQQTQLVYDKTNGTALLNWDYSTTTTINNDDGDIWVPRVYLEYVLFDGSDALIANFLMKQNIPVNVVNVQAHKRMIIRNKLMADISERNQLESDLESVPRRLI